MSNHATDSSHDILFDAPSTSSPELSFSTPHAEPLKLDSNAPENRESPTLEDRSNELEGLRTVNITPTGEDEEKRLGNSHTASPPMVFKSVPTTPVTGLFPSDDDKSISTPNTLTNELGSTNQRHMEDEDDPRELVIDSLRTQISDLFSQVAMLNSKLVQSYDRVSTLEETLDENTEQLRALEGERMNLENEKNLLELERTKHDEMIRDGKLVERSAVAAELTRLMEESMESSSARKDAEAKHAQIESELSDLSANLFSTANEMVAKERKARSAVEESLAASTAESRRLQSEMKALEIRLADNGRAVEILQEERRTREGEVKELRQVVRSIDLVGVNSTGSGTLRMMNSHVPYKTEYLGFISHLRKLLPTTPNPPSITTVLSLPFLQRLAVEDSEPTLRLDLAPSLNWLTRRSVLAAIHSNTLLIEQVHVATLFLENNVVSYSYSPFTSGNTLPTSPTQLTKVVCALCGKVVYMSPEAIQAEQYQYQALQITQSPTTPTPTTTTHQPTASSPQRTNSGGGWAAAKFLKSVNLSSLGSTVSGSGSGSGTSTPVTRTSLEVPSPNGPAELVLDRPPSPPPPTSLQTVIHAFRVPAQGRSNSTASNPPLSAIDSPSENYGPPYPLCHSGWCLARLKTTCELWEYVGNEILERVWREARSVDLRDKLAGRTGRGSFDAAINGTDGAEPIGSDINPPPPPPKKKIPNLWGMGSAVLDKFGSGSGEGSPSTTASSLFSGMRRTFSGPNTQPNNTSNNTSSTTLVGRHSLDGLKEVDSGLQEEVESPTAITPASRPTLPKRNTSRLSAVFTGGEAGAEGNAKAEGGEIVTESSPQIPPEASASSDAFVTPSETPVKGMSPIIEREVETKTDQPPMLAETGGGEEVVKTTESLSVNGSKDVDVEPPTPTPANTGFAAKSERPAHQRTLSAASVSSELQGASTPRPSTPKRSSGLGGSLGSRPSTPSKLPTSSRPSTPNKGPAGSRPSTPSRIPTIGNTATTNPAPGSRPSTPTKGVTGAPPPLPRRAAARNAARVGSGSIPKKEVEAVLEEKRKEDAAKEGKEEKLEGAEEKVTEPLTDLGMKTDEPASILDTQEKKPTTETTPAAEPVVPDSSTIDADATITVEPAASEVQEKDIPTPKSISIPLPPLDPSAAPPLPPRPSESEEISTRPRQPSVSTSSVYSPSVYTTHSNIPGGGEDTTEGGEKGIGGRENSMNQFYVGRGSWEERAWLELVRIRESMFWARLGGVRR